MRRRSLLKLVGAVVATRLAVARAAEAGGPYAGRFVDAHLHMYEQAGLSAEAVVQTMDAAGVDAGHLFGEPWWIGSDAAGRFPNRLVPYLGEGYATALHPDSSYMNPAGLNQLLGGRVVRGLGEVICRHSPFQLGASGNYVGRPVNNVPADEPRLIEAYRRAAAHGAPVNIHQEAYAAEELDRALRAAPDTTFVWAHVGHGPPVVVRTLMQRNPNLMADLSARSPWLGPGTVLLRADGSLQPEWTATLTEYADRFVVGLDFFAPGHFEFGYATRMAAYYRAMLGQLSPDAARLIGHANADRLLPVRTV
jgi:hypothetical protein